jgi:uncharacterized membrane protein YedE/YeeE
MRYAIALLCGLVFGAGLAVSGMTNPQKVLGFLDVAAIWRGAWDPTLLMVFVGALPVMFIAYRIEAARTGAPLVASESPIDAKLIGGSALFGIGWGLVGLCPGPAVAALALADRTVLPSVLTFFGALLLGVWMSNVLNLRGEAPAESDPA